MRRVSHWVLARPSARIVDVLAVALGKAREWGGESKGLSDHFTFEARTLHWSVSFSRPITAI